MVSLPLGVLVLLKYSAVTSTSALVAYSCFFSSSLQMSAAKFSMPVVGAETVESTTSLMASGFLERWEPFWVAGRSTNTSMVQNMVPLRSEPSMSLLMRTGFLTPLTPTLVSLKLISPALYCTSHLGII